MKVIDLLNKIANNEEVPKEIIYNDETLFFDNKSNNYIYESGKEEYWTDCFIINFKLNDEIEIIEEKPISLKPFKDYLSDLGIVYITDEETTEYIHQMSLKINYLLEKESDK